MKIAHFKKQTEKLKNGRMGITLIALVITIVLNCCEAAMERMLKKQLILKFI